MLLETDTTEFQILPATPAILDLLAPPIPAGFTQACFARPGSPPPE